MPSLSPAHFLPIAMLVGSNVFMTFAWYGHLSDKSTVVWLKEPLGWNHAIGFVLIAAGAFFIFQGKA
ncbi:DMT family protein [Bosea sp. BIWAKO-01]|uniref:DMT family protein n=1 Tax=Bosea sp. BIWAKO-01 TaxID=506668 RepID=UPI000853408B|nr:DMT family protein [Bosea sp. BIWAKO-01]GAU83679.1 hypothetical protein BIWAKO_03606 [Bosea sp. BIWAKO-01]